MIRATSVLLVLTLASTSLAAATAPTSEERAMAETLFFTGRGLMEAGRYAEACQKFDESYRIFPAAGTLLNLAVCHEGEGKLAKAWAEFKQALAEAKKMDRPDREELATARLAVIEPELPYLAIRVPANVRVAGLEIERNGTPLLSGGWGTELPVDPGEVEIVARAPGHKPRSTKIKIERKQHLAITIEPLEVLPPPPPSSVPVADRPGWTTQRTVGFAMIGAGVVALGVGGYFGVRAASAKSDSDDACPLIDGERRCSETGSARMADARRDAWVSNIGIGVGVASVAIGTYLFIRGARSEPRAAKPLDWSIAGGPTSVYGALVCSF
jgi:hypothetical protein